MYVEPNCCFSPCGVLKSNNDYRLRAGWKIWHTRKPPVIWQLKALARGAGTGGNQGVQRPPPYHRGGACNSYSCVTRVFKSASKPSHLFCIIIVPFKCFLLSVI